MDKSIKAGEFKTNCLKIIDNVKTTGKSVIITKRNVPYAKLIPINKKEEKFFGSMKGTGRILGDIMEPIDEVWDANS